MRLAVCVKQVPDSWAEKKMKGSLLDRAGVDAVLNDLDEYAVEAALRLIEEHSPTGAAGEESGHSLTIISMGTERATEAIRKALSMGADNAILISDAALTGSDSMTTASVLSRVISEKNFDIVFCGTESTDARMSVIPSMLAEHLGSAQLTFAGALAVEPSSKKITIERVTDLGIEKMESSFPAVVSVIEKINEPRYPSFKGIMAAKKKSIEVKTLNDLGVDPASVGSSGALSLVVDSSVRPPRQAGIKIVDEGNGGNDLAKFLSEKRFV